MVKTRILLIEDEKKIARFLELELVHEGYEVNVASSGQEGLDFFRREPHTLILLDIMLPDMDGIAVLSEIRKQSFIPVILLTARSETADKVLGLDAGADDYITKPFAIEELFARVRVIVKRLENADENIIRVKDLCIDLSQRTAFYKDIALDLTKTEFELLTFMCQNKNEILSRDQILNKVWGYNYFGETNVVDVYIRYLRSKLDDRFSTKLIHTKRGVGYGIRDEEE